MLERKMVMEKLFNVIVEALSLDDVDSVSLDSRLIEDLGAESIDFIDICFRLEKEFGLEEVNVNNIYPLAYQEKGLLDTSGNLIPDVVEKIKENYPHIDDEIFNKVLEKGDATILFSINIISKYIERNAE